MEQASPSSRRRAQLKSEHLSNAGESKDKGHNLAGRGNRAQRASQQGFLGPLVHANSTCLSAALGWKEAHAEKMMTRPPPGTATFTTGAAEGTERQDRVEAGAQTTELDSWVQCWSCCYELSDLGQIT